MRTTEQRLVDLEAAVRVLHSRVIQLEGGTTASAPVARPTPVRQRRVEAPPSVEPNPSPARPAPRPAPPPRIDFEDLLGGRVLAWLGGIAVVLGTAFFFALAISRGWIDEATRTVIAGLGSAAILGVGIWLREKRSRAEAAMAAASTGLAGLFLTLVVAARVYYLLPAVPAMILALVVGAAGTALSVRWNAQVVAAIGTLGSVLAPALAGAHHDGTTVALLFTATAAGAAILVHKRWTWLAVGLFATATPQWAPWAAGDASTAGALAALGAFGSAGLLTSVGFELRSGTQRVRHSAAFLLAANSLILALTGWIAFAPAGATLTAKLWLAALALVHLGAGGSMRLERRISRELAVLTLGLGVVLADIAWAAFVDGPGVTAGWALSAIAFAWSSSRKGLESVERRAAALGLGGQVVVALGHVLVSDVPPSQLTGTASADGLFAVATLAAACLISGRFADDGKTGLRGVIDGLGLAALAYLTAATLDGAAVVVALATEACVLAAIARIRDDAVAGGGALAFLGLAAAHALVVEAPPAAFLYGVHALGGSALAIAAVAVAAVRLGLTMRLGAPWPRALKTGAAITALYGASVTIVTLFQPGAGVEPTAALEIGVRQEGQMLVSALWSVAGAVALVIGLTRDSRDLRRAGLALLVAAIGKVFLFDLATLASVYRVISFVGLGVVLLAGSYAWQRMRPAPLPDLREV